MNKYEQNSREGMRLAQRKRGYGWEETVGEGENGGGHIYGVALRVSLGIIVIISERD